MADNENKSSKRGGFGESIRNVVGRAADDRRYRQNERMLDDIDNPDRMVHSRDYPGGFGSPIRDDLYREDRIKDRALRTRGGKDYNDAYELRRGGGAGGGDDVYVSYWEDENGGPATEDYLIDPERYLDEYLVEVPHSDPEDKTLVAELMMNPDKWSGGTRGRFNNSSWLLQKAAAQDPELAARLRAVRENYPEAADALGLNWTDWVPDSKNNVYGNSDRVLQQVDSARKLAALLS